MSVTAVVGAGWGDEGKGKITDCLASKSDVVVRFQGGANAGHTIINDYGKFVLHILPSGVFQKDTVNILGTGVALDIEKFINELRMFKDNDVPEPTVYISDRAQVLMPYHILLDEYEEERRAGHAFGSTKSGIAPFYSDKYSKIGIQVADLLNPSELSLKVKQNLEIKNILFEHLYGKRALDADAIIEKALTFGEKIKDRVVDYNSLIINLLSQNKNILLEGQLGALKDTDNGIYPWVTSSSTLAGFSSVGAAMPPSSITDVVAVAKAYSSCVGAGPFVVELKGEMGEWIRKNGGDSGEYGATTGRPRRVGWFDSVATSYGCRLQGATKLAVTNLDVLSGLDQIMVCDKYELDGAVISNFPTTSKLYRAKPVYKKFDGWKRDITDIRSYNELPDNAKRYVDYIEKICDVKVGYISNGPHRDALIEV